MNPKIKEIQNKTAEDKISIKVYPPFYYKQFNPNNEFEKWPTIKVKDFEKIPDGMKSFILEDGLYTAFSHKGSSSGNSKFQYIFFERLPNLNYVIDDRPHFEVLDSNYNDNDPNSEEEIWIPIRKK